MWLNELCDSINGLFLGRCNCRQFSVKKGKNISKHRCITSKEDSCFITSRPFLKTAGGIVLGSVAVSADVLPYISVAIKASFLKLGMCNICKNNIAKMFLDF